MPVQCIKRFIMHSKKTAFIVEHDFIMAAYLADRVILYEGTPSAEVRALGDQPIEGETWILNLWSFNSLMAQCRCTRAHPPQCHFSRGTTGKTV